MNRNEEIVTRFWGLFDEAKFDEAAMLMASDARIRWCNTKELFTNRDNFILANKNYPGRWRISIEKLVSKDEMVISVVKIDAEDHSFNLYATSFFTLKNGEITEIEEYFGENGEPPAWRTEAKLAERY